MSVGNSKSNQFISFGLLGAFCFVLTTPQPSQCAPKPEPNMEYTHISDNQETMAIASAGELDFSGVSIQFYDSRGNRLGAWKKTPGAMRHGEFSSDGRFFFVMMHPSPAKAATQKPLASSYVLSSSGAVLHHFQSEPEPILRFSPSGDYLYSAKDKNFAIVGLDGTLKWTHQCLAGPYFSPDGAIVVALDGKTAISLRNWDGKLLEKLVISELGQLREGMPSVRTVSNDGDIFIYLGASVRKLIVLNAKGDVLRRLSLVEFPSAARFADKEKREVIIDVWEHGKPGTRERRRREIRLK